MPYNLGDQLIYWLGEKRSGFPTQAVQKYEEIRAECIKKGILWEDPLFKGGSYSVCQENTAECFDKIKTITEWKRPKDIVKHPKFFVNGYHKFDVEQGYLGDCWLIASITGLTLLPPALFHRVVPKDQDFDDDYAGVFHFRFWQFGCWVDVVVDDRLPVVYNKLAFATSGSEEFWVALLEKAYAKLHGSYGTLSGGFGSEALEDFTGGISETFSFRSNFPKNIFDRMGQAFQHNWPMVCSVSWSEEYTDNLRKQGLINSHAYTITAVKCVNNINEGTENLVRIRNPHGNRGREWNGDWSDGSRKWEMIPNSEKELIGYGKGPDSEFWMSFDDFTKLFTYLEICSWCEDCPTVSVLPTCMKDGWMAKSVEGEWGRWSTAGGSQRHGSYKENPRYKIKIFDKDDERKEKQECTVIIALMQNHRKTQRIFSRKYWTHNFTVYEYIGEQSDSDTTYSTNKPVLKTSNDSNVLREVIIYKQLQPGEYTLVPYTKFPHQSCEFLLRVYADTAVSIEKITGSNTEQPSDADKTLEIFAKYVGNDTEIGWEVLKTIIDDEMWQDDSLCEWFVKEYPEGFSKKFCRSLLALYDNNHSARLGLDEFRDLRIDFHHWKIIFAECSQSTRGWLNCDELKESLKRTYFPLKRINDYIYNHLSQTLMKRHGEEDCVAFDTFLICALRFMKTIEYFNARDTIEADSKAYLEMDLYDWFDITLY